MYLGYEFEELLRSMQEATSGPFSTELVIVLAGVSCYHPKSLEATRNSCQVNTCGDANICQHPLNFVDMSFHQRQQMKTFFSNLD